MNYFAHAFEFLDRSASPMFLAGLAVPDWLNVVDRKIKARSKSARSLLNSGELSDDESHLAQGVIQHHADDDWFHQGQAFNEICLEFTVELRDLLQPDPGFRPSFLGHILVELLLDDFLIHENPGVIDKYYAVMESVDEWAVEQGVSRIAGKPAVNLNWFIGRFRVIRFLLDYRDNEKLLGRLNQIMQRVKLLPLPHTLFGFFDSARDRVSNRADELYFSPLATIRQNEKDSRA